MKRTISPRWILSSARVLRGSVALWTLVSFTQVGCYSTASPRGACLNPLGQYQASTGAHPSQLMAAPVVNQPAINQPVGQPGPTTIQTAPMPAQAQAMPNQAALPEVVTNPMMPSVPGDEGQITQASFGTASAMGVCADGSCGTAPGGNCGCASCAPSWTPNCLPQYCVNPQEYLCDGGDKAPQVKVSVSGEPLGLGTQDTVVTYEGRDGNPEVSASNCVCVYSPRFAAVRQVSTAAQGDRAIAAVGLDNPVNATPMKGRVPNIVVSDIRGPEKERLVRGPDAYKERNRAVPVAAELRPILARDVLEVFAGISVLETGILKERDIPLLKASALAATVLTGRDVVDVMIDTEQAVEITLDRAAEELKVYEVQGKGKLRICKVADRSAVQIGDTVTFVLRVDNIGDGPVNNVVISDSLTTRLEYVPDSQACTKGAIFSIKPNDAGSSIVTWKLTDDMKVGEGCIIRFRCKVR